MFFLSDTLLLEPTVVPEVPDGVLHDDDQMGRPRHREGDQQEDDVLGRVDEPANPLDGLQHLGGPPSLAGGGGGEGGGGGGGGGGRVLTPLLVLVLLERPHFARVGGGDRGLLRDVGQPAHGRAVISILRSRFSPPK